MRRLLLTSFAPYGSWGLNASALAVQSLDLSQFAADVTVREYPVCFQQTRAAIAADLQLDPAWDGILHVGQSVRANVLELELFALNAAQDESQPYPSSLEPNGPQAYRCRYDLVEWQQRLDEQALPAEISCHAGTYLCNALFYWSQHLTANVGTPIAFLHIPLAPSQRDPEDAERMLATSASARAVATLLHAMDSDTA